MRVVEGKRIDLEATVAESVARSASQGRKVALGGEKIEANWEIGVGHLAFENVLYLRGGFGGVKTDVIGRIVERGEKRNSLDVIPMEVGHQDINVDTLAGGAGDEIEA